jgi:hypothetical protein
VIVYGRLCQLCIVHINTRCDDCAGLSTGGHFGSNFTAKSKGSNLFLQLLFTLKLPVDCVVMSV